MKKIFGSDKFSVVSQKVKKKSWPIFTKILTLKLGLKLTHLFILEFIRKPKRGHLAAFFPLFWFSRRVYLQRMPLTKQTF